MGGGMTSCKVSFSFSFSSSATVNQGRTLGVDTPAKFLREKFYSILQALNPHRTATIFGVEAYSQRLFTPLKRQSIQRW